MADEAAKLGAARLVIGGGQRLPLGAVADATTNLVMVGRVAAAISGAKPLTFSVVDARIGSVIFDLAMPQNLSGAIEAGLPAVEAARGAIRNVVEFLAGDVGEALANVVAVLAFLQVISERRMVKYGRRQAAMAQFRQGTAAGIVPASLLEDALNDNVEEGVLMLLSEPKTRAAFSRMEPTICVLETSVGAINIDGTQLRDIYKSPPIASSPPRTSSTLIIVDNVDTSGGGSEECVINGLEVGGASSELFLCEDLRFSQFATTANLKGAVLDCTCTQHYAVSGISVRRTLVVTDVHGYRFPNSNGWLQIPQGTLTDA